MFTCYNIQFFFSVVLSLFSERLEKKKKCERVKKLCEGERKEFVEDSGVVEDGRGDRQRTEKVEYSS